MKRFIPVIIFFMLAAITLVRGQSSFVENCLGTWKGRMYIYSHGALKDSVQIRLTVAKTATTDAWSWKTEYLSAKMPMVKDYILRLKDPATNRYVTDEGGGVELADYLFKNKMYTVFETGGFILTSTYELLGRELIFEVTAGKKIEDGKEGVANYSVDTLQRVVLTRE